MPTKPTPRPLPVAELVALVTRRGFRPAEHRGLETFIAHGGCLGCGGHVAYPFDGALWFTGWCKACGKVRLVVMRRGFAYCWEPVTPKNATA